MTAFDRAYKRVDFRLTYDKTTETRHFTPDTLFGPDIPDAFSDRFMPGEWYQADTPSVEDLDVTEADWHETFAAMVVNEAVHEALEWFQVDGEPWLNPHGEHDLAIYEAVNALVQKLAALKRSSSPVEGKTTASPDSTPKG